MDGYDDYKKPPMNGIPQVTRADGSVDRSLYRKLSRAAHNTVSAMEHSRYDVIDKMVQAYRERYGVD